jgi:hypothetical protein
MPLHLRADDGIRTRDPHLGKVMRYQLRYIRAPRTTSSPVAKDDDSPPQRSRTNSLDVRSKAALLSQTPTVLVWRLGSPIGAGPVAQWESVRFTRGRSLVRSQPGPPASPQVGALLSRICPKFDWHLPNFMRPICGHRTARWVSPGLLKVIEHVAARFRWGSAIRAFALQDDKVARKP